MKRLFLAASFSISIISCIHINTHTHPTKYQEDATTWINEYILDTHGALAISPNEFQLFANLLYFSYQRSVSTLHAQDIGMRTMQSMWHSWQNIAQTRLNPSKKVPFEIDHQQQKELTDLFQNAQLNHRARGLTYAQAVEYATAGKKAMSYRAQEGIKSLRKQSRSAVMQSMIDIKKQIQNLFECIHSYKSCPIDDDASFTQTRWNLSDCLWSWLPSLALDSVLKAEHAYTTSSEHLWALLNRLQAVSVQMWKTMEEERAAYYYAHYNELMHVYRTHGLAITSIHLMFDENGLIESTKNTPLLPVHL